MGVGLTAMKFDSTQQDTQKWAEFHSSEFAKKQMLLKRMMQDDLIKAIDELAEVEASNAKRIELLKESLNDNISENKRQIIESGIVKYESLTIVANKVSEVYLMLLDMYTYGTYCMLANDEWDWRAFARHFYTIIKEHPKTVSSQLNDIVRILKNNMEKGYDLAKLIRAKKGFTSFIESNAQFANLIRVNVDAHFDGAFEERLKLVQALSYYSFIELYYTYTSKMHEFLSELRPALVEFRRSADIFFYGRIVVK